MENPVTLRSKKAMGVLGKMIRDWTLDPALRPETKSGDGQRQVFTVGAFRETLNNAGLVEGRPDGADGDYAIREDIEEVELLPRQPNRFSMLLPEADMIRHLQSETGPLTLRMATLYAETEPAKHTTHAVDDEGPATYEVTLGADPFECFLDPYMAAYVCSQCR